MKWLKMSIIIMRSVAGATNGATSSPPRMRGRDREGACNMIKHVTPSPPLPRKRGREQTELAAPTDSISPTAFARTSRGVRKKSHDGLSVHGETARDADRLASDVGGVIGQQEGDEPGIIL